MSELFDDALQISLQKQATFINKSTDGDNSLATLTMLEKHGDTEVLTSAHLHERSPRLLTWRWDKWCRAPPPGRRRSTDAAHLLHVE